MVTVEIKECSEKVLVLINQINHHNLVSEQTASCGSDQSLAGT